MNIKRFNWQIWAGFLLAIVAAFSFPFFFVNFPVTRDFPWANLLLFVAAAALVFIGLKRAFSAAKSEGGEPKRSTLSKIVASGLAALSVLIIGAFIFSFFVMAKWLPPSTGAPQVGQKAPEFTLSDATGKTVSLSELISSPIPAQANGPAPKGVLLIFYRGYW
jgi:hypothetical protein